MGCCMPNNRGYDLIKSNISQKELKSGTKIFDVRKDDGANDDNISKKSQNENNNKGLINNIIDTNNNKNIW